MANAIPVRARFVIFIGIVYAPESLQIAHDFNSVFVDESVFRQVVDLRITSN